MRSLIALSAMVGVTWACAGLNADDQAKGIVLIEVIQDVHLTPQQEGKIADIQKDWTPKVREAAKELGTVVKEELEKIRSVLTPEQLKKVEAAKEERTELRGERLVERIVHLKELDLTEAEVAKFTEIRKEYRPKIEKAMKGLEGLLTSDQKKARVDALKAGERRKEVLESLKLTSDQKEKVEAVGTEVRSLLREELEKMRDVLTEGQREKLQEFADERRESVRDRMAHRIANLKDLNLTENQRTKIADIRKEYRPKVHEAGNKLRATIKEEADKILDVLKG
jgi:Spy/CpxP family protein refolding chaperone